MSVLIGNSNFNDCDMQLITTTLCISNKNFSQRLSFSGTRFPTYFFYSTLCSGRVFPCRPCEALKMLGVDSPCPRDKLFSCEPKKPLNVTIILPYGNFLSDYLCLHSLINSHTVAAFSHCSRKDFKASKKLTAWLGCLQFL